MQKAEIVIKKELFDAIGVEVGQVNYEVKENNDFRLCGSVSSDNEKLKGYSLCLKANLCDENGGILFVNMSYSGISFEVIPYDGFSMQCSDLSRFFPIEKLKYIELYPSVRKKKEEC